MASKWLYVLILAVLVAAGAVGQTAAASPCDGAKHPIIILPGIMASQINASYSGVNPLSPCVGRKKNHQIWPPAAKDILPTGFACWKYLIQLEYDGRTKTFGNNRGVKVVVEQGGRSGTKFNLFQGSYSNLTNYLVHTMGYTLGHDLFAAPYDWRMHISGLEQSGQMDLLMAHIENAVTNNCGKRAILIGHSMGGLVSVALLQRDAEWSQNYVKGLITMSAPFGGTTDQAITVRMGAVEWNINEWVKNPISRIAKDLAAHAQDMAKALEDDELNVATASLTAARRVSRSAARRASQLAGVIGHRAHRLHHGDDDAEPSSGVIPEAGQVATAALPKPINNMVKNYISSAFFKVTMGLPGLAMLLPYPSAYGAWRRIVVTNKRTYTASMMKRLMADIGDSVTQHAWPKVQELDRLTAKGQIPGVATYCMYGHQLDTTLTWSFPNIQENKAALTATPLVTTSGDGTVSVQSLKQCYKITSNITELGAYGHLEVLKNKATLAQIREVIREITQNPDGPTTQNPERMPQWPTPDDHLGHDESPDIHDDFSDEEESSSDYNDPWELEVDTEPHKAPFTHLRNDEGLPAIGDVKGPTHSFPDSSSSSSDGSLKLQDPTELKPAPFTKSMLTPSTPKDTSEPVPGSGSGSAPGHGIDSDVLQGPADTHSSDHNRSGDASIPPERLNPDSSNTDGSNRDASSDQALSSSGNGLLTTHPGVQPPMHQDTPARQEAPLSSEAVSSSEGTTSKAGPVNRQAGSTLVPPASTGSPHPSPQQPHPQQQQQQQQQHPQQPHPQQQMERDQAEPPPFIGQEIVPPSEVPPVLPVAIHVDSTQSQQHASQVQPTEQSQDSAKQQRQQDITTLPPAVVPSMMTRISNASSNRIGSSSSSSSKNINSSRGGSQQLSPNSSNSQSGDTPVKLPEAISSHPPALNTEPDQQQQQQQQQAVHPALTANATQAHIQKPEPQDKPVSDSKQQQQQQQQQHQQQHQQQQQQHQQHQQQQQQQQQHLGDETATAGSQLSSLLSDQQQQPATHKPQEAKALMQHVTVASLTVAQQQQQQQQAGPAAGSMQRKISGVGHVGGHTSRSHVSSAQPKTAAQKQPAAVTSLLELDESAHAASSSSSSSGSNAMLSQASSRPVAAGRTSSSPGAATEALPPRALLLPKPVSVLEPDTNPLSNYQLVGPPRSVALGEAWAHQVLDVASGACLLALANGEKPPPGCV